MAAAAAAAGVCVCVFCIYVNTTHVTTYISTLVWDVNKRQYCVGAPGNTDNQHRQHLNNKPDNLPTGSLRYYSCFT